MILVQQSLVNIADAVAKGQCNLLTQSTESSTRTCALMADLKDQLQRSRVQPESPPLWVDELMNREERSRLEGHLPAVPQGWGTTTAPQGGEGSTTTPNHAEASPLHDKALPSQRDKEEDRVLGGISAMMAEALAEVMQTVSRMDKHFQAELINLQDGQVKLSAQVASVLEAKVRAKCKRC